MGNTQDKMEPVTAEQATLSRIRQEIAELEKIFEQMKDLVRDGKMEREISPGVKVGVLTINRCRTKLREIEFLVMAYRPQ